MTSIAKWVSRIRGRVADARGRGPFAGYPDRYQCVFVHIPKTAGSSISTVLFGEDSRHLSWRDYDEANPGKLKRYFSFAFVRNPWDRLVSSFHFLKQGGLNEADRQFSDTFLQDYGDFRTFVRHGLPREPVRDWVHFRPQSDFIFDDDDRLRINYIGRFETLVSDFDHVARRLGISAELPWQNRGRHEPFSSYYDDELAGIAGDIYQRDIRLLEYEFEAKE